jgi:MFS family permease
VITLLLAVLWAAYATDHPVQHRSVNGQERQLIEQSDPPPQPRIGPSNPDLADLGCAPGNRIGVWAKVELLLCNRSLLLLTISYAAVGYFEYLFFYWIDYYFDKVLELGKEEARLCATIPNLAMAVGMALGGWLADRAQKRFGDRRGRAVVPVGGMVASALLLGLGITSVQPTWVVIWFALAMTAVGACEAAFWVTGIELGRRQGGTSAAILNTGGNAGGLLAPVVTPLFSEYFGWQAGLSLASVFCLVGAVLWYWIDPAER